MIAIAAGVVLVAVAAALVLNAFQGNVVFFFSPSQVASGEAPVAKTFRIGGMVEKGSLKRLPDGVTVQFVVTDSAKTIPVTYRGLAPDTFTDAQEIEVVVEGRLSKDGVFHATTLLAKCGSRYEAQYKEEGKQA